MHLQWVLPLLCWWRHLGWEVMQVVAVMQVVHQLLQIWTQIPNEQTVKKEEDGTLSLARLWHSRLHLDLKQHEAWWIVCRYGVGR